MRKIILLFALGFATVSVRASSPVSFDEWAERFAAEWVRLSPQTATLAQYFEGAEQAALDRELDPVTTAHRERRVRMAKQGILELQRWPDAALSTLSSRTAQP